MAAVVVSDEQRRARLASRHALTAERRVGTVDEGARAVVALHSTEPASPYLSLWARMRAVSPSDIDRALYVERGVVKQLAMRRTLFVFPRDLLPAAWGSSSARVADTERRKLAANVVHAGLADDGEHWLAGAADAILTTVGAHGSMNAREIRAAIPSIDVSVSSAPGTKWGDAPAPIVPRLLTWLGASARIVRGDNRTHWRTSQPRWTLMSSWLDETPVALDARLGYAELVRRWLYAFGPGTDDDIVWWLGATKAIVRAALADVGAVAVTLESGQEAWLLPDDLEPIVQPAPWAALLPALDPTTMGWKHRSFHLDPTDVPYLFDRNGNGGTTAWWNGRIVGCWVQGDDGTVRVVLRADPGRDARSALEAEAERLTAWLDGVVVSTIYKSPQMKGALLP